MSIERILLTESERIQYPAQLFGTYFPFYIEPVIYHWASTLSADYTGGYWQMYRLSNGGFSMYPDSDTPFLVVTDNYFQGTLSPEALGITACLYTFSHLSFSDNPALSELCGEHFHLLREYALGHPESAAILAAID
jgi:hypothetical protein